MHFFRKFCNSQLYLILIFLYIQFVILSICLRILCFYQYQAMLYYAQVLDSFNLQKIKEGVNSPPGQGGF